MTINAYRGRSFDEVCRIARDRLLDSEPVNTGEWQSQKITDPNMVTREIQNFSFDFSIPPTKEILAQLTGANLPWAEDHFRERVSGEPLNPAPSEGWWPYRQNGNAAHKSEGTAFSHTYPERIWPKMANVGGSTDLGRQVFVPHVGIRFAYGDLEDLLQQLGNSPLTRQAYLPIWFPEDTGAVHGKRVPCTLGYHFMIRNGRMNVNYYMRSCDFRRHFRDDVYMASRMVQWLVDNLRQGWNYDLVPGDLNMHVASFHCFEGDVAMMKTEQASDPQGTTYDGGTKAFLGGRVHTTLKRLKQYAPKITIERID